ncbi:MAG: trypsin-like peptidase domain-containing protein [Planctomycetota bacterium]|nr:trypsin-like peptidase domain-containing protein [Planctomycetota bacterium]
MGMERAGGRRRVAVSTLVLALMAWSPTVAQEPSGREERGKVHSAIEKAIPRVVKIVGASGIRNIPGNASGTIISRDGHILTIDSVLLKTDRLRVVLSDGRTLKAKILRRDKYRSIALLKVDAGEPLPFFPPENPGPLRVGQWVLSVANPFNLAQGDEWPSVNLGIVSAVTRLDLRLGVNDFPYRGKVIVTDANNNPGGFGGALLDLEGRLIGINGKIVESKETNTQISYAVPIQTLIPLIDGSIILRKDETEEKVAGFHGIRLFDLGTRKSPPAYLRAVAKESPAARAGLRRDDLIIRCQQTPVRNCKDFYEVAGQFGPGEEIAITFKRKEEIHQVVITLEEG